MSERFRLGLRVDDVDAAAAFYEGLGFRQLGSVPDPEGRPVMTILERAGVNLIVDALAGMPFADTERERKTSAGPLGLGVAIGLGVDDLDSTLAYCRAAGCTITSEPMDEAWGERVFECVDPFGYQWEFSHPAAEATIGDGLAAVQAAWFGAENH
jgi:uncharacterized glyoxalase superfamily protein PhnB